MWTRTNHAYDPEFLENAVGGPVPDPDSFLRYMLLHDTIVGYATSGVQIADAQAINITALVGDKGGSDLPSFLTCDGPNTYVRRVNVAAVSKDAYPTTVVWLFVNTVRYLGENIVSAVFLPADQAMYIAFENGHDSAHLPAACNPYVYFDLKPWF